MTARMPAAELPFMSAHGRGIHGRRCAARRENPPRVDFFLTMHGYHMRDFAKSRPPSKNGCSPKGAKMGGAPDTRRETPTVLIVDDERDVAEHLVSVYTPFAVT